MAEKFVRFVTHENDEVTGLAIGFFQAAYDFCYDGSIPSVDVVEIKKHLDWFKEYLDKPTRFARSKNKHAHEKALSWFKPEAVDHIDKARELLAVLERHGVQSEMLTTAKPGVIVYEDEWQVAAIPFKDKDF